jgi:predicted HicB family RNase H-like nuclease
MNYKGFLGHVEYDEERKFFHGEILNTRSVITFQGTTVSEIEKEFKDSIDDYLDWCKERGKEPEKPYSGKFNLRISPELHRKIALVSKKQNLSLNKFVEKALIDELATY